MNKERIRNCFISAPQEVDIHPIRHALNMRGVEVLGLHNVLVGTSWQAALISIIAQADLVIGVLTHGDSANTIFELGVAVGSRKPLLIFAPAKGDTLPSDLTGFQVVRTNLYNREAVDFALEQFLASPPGVDREHTFKPFSTTKPAIETSIYKNQLATILREGRMRELEVLIGQVLRESGAEVVAEADFPDRGIDLVVWWDGLQAFVDNPFPIEVKGRIRSRDDAKRAISQTEKSAQKIGARWSMLLYGEGPAAGERVWLSNPAVLTLKIDDLLNRLQSQSFPDIVRTLRNRRAHGLDF